MSGELFGIDVAGIVSDALAAAGGLRDLTFTKVTPGTRTAGNLTGGTAPTSVAYPGKGFSYDENVGTTERDGTLVRVSQRAVAIVGRSLPAGVVPAPNDLVKFPADGHPDAGRTYRIDERVRYDPAGAMFLCDVVGK